MYVRFRVPPSSGPNPASGQHNSTNRHRNCPETNQKDSPRKSPQQKEGRQFPGAEETDLAQAEEQQRWETPKAGPAAGTDAAGANESRGTPNGEAYRFDHESRGRAGPGGAGRRSGHALRAPGDAHRVT